MAVVGEATEAIKKQLDLIAATLPVEAASLVSKHAEAREAAFDIVVNHALEGVVNAVKTLMDEAAKQLFSLQHTENEDKSEAQCMAVLVPLEQPLCEQVKQKVFKDLSVYREALHMVQTRCLPHVDVSAPSVTPSGIW